MWWDNDTIERNVTREFVCDHLLPREVERLDQPLGFGHNLTDGTYWEWIEEKAKKIFLILVDLGLPDQIFGLIDDSWDDQDLPIPLDQVERLALTPSKDEKTERRFYFRQFHYLLRPLQEGEHIVYEDDEVVPMDVLDKKHAVSQNYHVARVVLPDQPGMVFCRSRIPLGPESLRPEEFLHEVRAIRDVQNEHLLSYWASYAHQGYGYIIFTPAAEFTLKSLLSTTPGCLKNLDKNVRQQTVLDWIHCLVDTVCFLHSRGLAHGHIKPSAVMFTNDNRVFFSDFTNFHTEILGGMTERNSFDKEAYDYAAPEQWLRPRSTTTTTTASAGRGSSSSSSSSSTTTTMTQAPTTRHLDPQAADIFSLGCVIMELLSFLLKKQGRPFAAHRATKHKTAGRGGAVLDSSFHQNLGQVESWMTLLAKEAARKKDDALLKGVVPMLHVMEKMLAFYPSERPAAGEVQARMYHILTESCGIAEPHCVHYGGPDLVGMGRLRLGSSPPGSAKTGDDDTAWAAKMQSRTPMNLSLSRSSSGGSGGSGSVREAEAERARAAVMPGSPQAAKEMLARDDARRWQAPFYATGNLRVV